MTERGLSERRALAVIGMSPSALRYTPAPDRNVALRARILALAHRHRRYGVGMIYLKLRQAGETVNYKRVERLYVAERLQVRRWRRKKVPAVDRQPLARPTCPNEVWSADFVFDRTAEGRVLKCLAIVDDATTEAVAVVPARALGGPAGDAHSGSVGARARPPQGVADRQRPRVLRPGHVDLGARPRRDPPPDRTGQAESERVHRIVQWAIARRVSERALVFRCYGVERSKRRRCSRFSREHRRQLKVLSAAPYSHIIRTNTAKAPAWAPRSRCQISM